MKTEINQASLPYLLHSSYGQRWHQHHFLSQIPDQLGRHQWAVAIIYLAFFGLNINTLLAILLHDVDERSTGDVPRYAKRANPEFAKQLEIIVAMVRGKLDIAHYFDNLPEEEFDKLNFCDILESYIHVHLFTTNGFAKESLVAWRDNIDELATKCGIALEAVDKFIYTMLNDKNT